MVWHLIPKHETSTHQSLIFVRASQPVEVLAVAQALEVTTADQQVHLSSLHLVGARVAVYIYIPTFALHNTSTKCWACAGLNYPFKCAH